MSMTRSAALLAVAAALLGAASPGAHAAAPQSEYIVQFDSGLASADAHRDAVERSGMKAKQVFQPLRVALTGTTISPGIFETVALVGRDRALARIDAALDLRRGA